MFSFTPSTLGIFEFFIIVFFPISSEHVSVA